MSTKKPTYSLENPEHQENFDQQASAISELRIELRRRMIAAREALPQDTRALANTYITHQLKTLLARLSFKVLGFCWPYRAEFDVRSLLVRFLARGIRAGLPVIAQETKTLVFKEWTPYSIMIDAHYGIPIPKEGETLVPEVLLIPLNAFDDACFRLGYGGGYFDRTLAQMTPCPVRIGIGFELARVESIYPQPYDLPMDFIVTEAGIHLPKEYLT